MTDRQILRALVVAGNRMRATPVVDDDFPANLKAFDNTLDNADKHVSTTQPETPRFRIECTVQKLQELRLWVDNENTAKILMGILATNPMLSARLIDEMTNKIISQF